MCVVFQARVTGGVYDVWTCGLSNTVYSYSIPIHTSSGGFESMLDRKNKFLTYNIY